jgi:pimeloyl-ACP methyl ester carboxylesterase
VKVDPPHFDQIPGPPARRGLVREVLGLVEPIRLAARLPSLADHPRGENRPLLVLPGFGASDQSTWILRRYLTWLGYAVEGWGLGRNTGRVPQLIPRIVERLAQLSQQHEDRVGLVGWSLGGYLAREAARERPDLVTRVVTLGSPVVGGPKYTLASRHYQRHGFDLDEIEASVAARDQLPLETPVTAIFSKRDGVVSWQACIDRINASTEHVEVNTTHVGLGMSPDVFAIIADRLGR